MAEPGYYERCWRKLEGEFEYLAEKKVRNISPYIILGYMDYIEQIEDKEVKQK